MATILFNENPQAEAQALIEILQGWLAEQPVLPPHASEGHFKYRTDGTLQSVVLSLKAEDGE